MSNTNEREIVNTNYNWEKVSDEYLGEIIQINLKTARRFATYGQFAKFDRAMDNVKVAQEQIEKRRNV
jgi:hypothetical protein